MKILITGAAGFVGHHFLQLPELANCEQVIATYNSKLPLIDIADNFLITPLALTDFVSVKNFLQQHQPTHILHLAAQSSVAKSWQEPHTTMMANISMANNLLEAVRQLELSAQLLFVSSAEVYAPSNDPINELFATHTHNPYALSKLTQEHLCEIYHSRYHINVVSTRSFSQIGPHQNLNFAIPSFAQQINEQLTLNKPITLDVGNIDVIRDFSDVRDMVKAYWMLLTQPHQHLIYNICSGQGYSLRNLIDTMADIIGQPISTTINPDKLRPSDNPIMIGNASRLLNEFKYVQQYDIATTLKDVLEAYQ